MTLHAPRSTLHAPRANAPSHASDPATPGLLMPLFSPGANGDLSTSTVGLSFAGAF